MVRERETASGMLARQEREREMFLVDQVKRLDDAKFGWELPMDFRVKHAYTGGIGLPILEVTREELSSGELSLILHPQRGLLLVNHEGQVCKYTAEECVPEWFFREIEQKVNETLASLQAAKVPA